MAKHTFICPACGKVKHTTNTKGHRCSKCGEIMYWDLKGIGVSDGDYCHVSDALAMCPSQIQEHGRLFPDVKVHSDGRPEFTSVKQHDSYNDKCGFVKLPQKIKREKQSTPD